MSESYVGLTKLFKFEAAHKLPEYVGKCAHLHGHSYKLKVTVTAPRSKMQASGVVVDFDIIKLAVNSAVVDVYDHKYLNDFFQMPTAENMIAQMHDDVVKALNDLGYGWVHVARLELWETDTCSAVYPVSITGAATESL